MKKRLIWTVLLLVFLAAPSALAEETIWYTNWDAAAKESQATNKPILIDFTGSDWCGWCMQLKAEVFDTETFQKWAAKNVVLLEVDFPNNRQLSPEEIAHNEKLARNYGIQGFPTIIFADYQGNALGRYGYDAGGPANWTKNAEAKMGK